MNHSPISIVKNVASNGVTLNGSSKHLSKNAATNSDAFILGCDSAKNRMSTAINTNSGGGGGGGIHNTMKSKKVELAAKIIKQSNIVCFDVDSTVIKEEGIDELAKFCGKGAEVARVTREAMGGSMTFQDALTIRLNIIRPTQKQIVDFIKLHPSTLSRNVKDFIDQLKAESKNVFLISGGFDCLIEPVAKELNIPLGNVYANKLMFYSNGEYAGFDTTQPTSKSGGKAEAVGIIKKKYPETLITMIGDGATDLESVPPADYFIGYGGNITRPEVFAKAQYFVNDFEQLMKNCLL